MEEVIKWCNLNSGFIMAMLTGVYVIATIVMPSLKRCRYGNTKGLYVPGPSLLPQ